MPVFSNNRLFRRSFVCFGVLTVSLTVLLLTLPTLCAHENSANDDQNDLHRPRVSFASQAFVAQASATQDGRMTQSKPKQLLSVAEAFDPSAQFRPQSPQTDSPPPSTPSSAKIKPNARTIRQASFNDDAEQSLPLELPPPAPSNTSKESFDDAFADGIAEEDLLDRPIENKNDIDDKDDALLDQTLSFSSGKSARERLTKPTLGSAVAPVVSVVGSLLIVLAAFLFLALLFKKISPKNGRLLPKEAFEDLGRTALTPKQSLHLLRLGNRLILVSVTPDGVSPITEISDPDEVVPLLGMCRRLDAHSSTRLFRKALSEVVEKDSSDSDYFGVDATDGGTVSGTFAKPVKKGKSPARPAVRPASNLDLYSDPDESLTSLLASGIPTKGGKHG